MANLGPTYAIPSPIRATPPRISLVSSAFEVPGAATDLRWINGIAFDPEMCIANADAYHWSCPPDGGEEYDGSKQAGITGFGVSLSPMSFGGTDFDSTFGGGNGLVIFQGGSSESISADGQTSTTLTGDDDIHVVLASTVGQGNYTLYFPANLFSGAETTARMQEIFDAFPPGGPTFTIENVKYHAFTANGPGVDFTWNGFGGFTEVGAVAVMGGGTTPPTIEAVAQFNAGPVSYRPYMLQAGDVCSAFGFEERDYAARAQRLLLACESRYIERELWGGVISDTAGLGNPFLTDGDSTTSLPSSADESLDRFGFATALAEMEKAFCSCSCGGEHMIHATPRLATLWQGRGLLRRDGNRLRTALDTIVVPGCGYSGSGPGEDIDDDAAGIGATEEWFYGTGLVALWRGPIQNIPEDISEALDRATNTIHVRAERAVAATWDQCCTLANKADLTQEYGSIASEEEGEPA